jgi:hypothetical protein
MPGSGGATWKGALHKITHTATGENECTETFAYYAPVWKDLLLENQSVSKGSNSRRPQSRSYVLKLDNLLPILNP